MIELLFCELLLPAFAISFLLSCNRAAFLSALYDHIAFKLCEGQQHIPEQRAYGAVIQYAYIKNLYRNAFVDKFRDQFAGSQSVH